MFLVRPFLAITLCGMAAAAAFALPAQAQQVFRIVGPDGKVTFSDKPPLESTAKVAPVGRAQASAGAPDGLPFALQQPVSKYPVTLYTGRDCNPCGAGRAYLTSRGVPFTERTVTSPQDVEALQRLAGGKSIPMLTVGGQQLPPRQPSLTTSQSSGARQNPVHRNPAPTTRPESSSDRLEPVCQNVNVLTPWPVPSRHSEAFWWPKTPTVTTPGHWLTSFSKRKGSLSVRPVTSSRCCPLSVTSG